MKQLEALEEEVIQGRLQPVAVDEEAVCEIAHLRTQMLDMQSDPSSVSPRPPAVGGPAADADALAEMEELRARVLHLQVLHPGTQGQREREKEERRS